MIRQFFLGTVLSMFFVNSALLGSDEVLLEFKNHSNTIIEVHIVFTSPVIKDSSSRWLMFSIKPQDSKSLNVDIVKLKISNITISSSDWAKTIVPYENQFNFPSTISVDKNGKIEITTSGQKTQVGQSEPSRIN